MLFSSIPFLYYFLPVVFLLYFLVPKKLRNTVLLVTSLVFYGWGEPRYVFLMIASILLGYVSGLLIERFQTKRLKQLVLGTYCALVLGILFAFKYLGFFTENLNKLGFSLPLIRIALPIGISFYTFQILSYAIDIYRGDTPAQKNPISFGAYITMFPQLIAGPIVRYSDIAKELNDRHTSWEDVRDGALLFLIGLGKKVLLANQLGEFCEIFRASGEQSVIFYWLYALAYAMHVFFDFSGYSDMAIGIGRIFGFHFIPNFNYPFISTSVTEFWRRWHMSLGTWFRDYVYIPLGGNRVAPWRRIFNILVVWALTGFWHGANWNFILWGLFYAALLITEKQISLKRLEKIPSVFRHLVVCVITMIGFVLFASEDLGQVGKDIAGLFGGLNLPLISQETLYYLRSFAVVLIISLLASTPVFSLLVKKVRTNTIGNTVVEVLTPLFMVGLLLLCTAYLVDGSFNPFLYFRF